MIGGPISNLLSGYSNKRKFERVRDALLEVSQELKDFKSTFSEDYVKTDDFEEILEITLRQIADERNEEMRRIYGQFLVGIIKSPGESYNDQLRFLRTLEEMQPDHIRVLRALLQSPNPDSGGIGSPRRTLEARLPDLSTEDIRGLVDDLNALRLTTLDNLGMMMTEVDPKISREELLHLGPSLSLFLHTLDNANPSCGLSIYVGPLVLSQPKISSVTLNGVKGLILS